MKPVPLRPEHEVAEQGLQLRRERRPVRLGQVADLVAGELLGAEPPGGVAADLARGESVMKCPSPLSLLKYTYDHSCY